MKIEVGKKYTNLIDNIVYECIYFDETLNNYILINRSGRGYSFLYQFAEVCSTLTEYKEPFKLEKEFECYVMPGLVENSNGWDICRYEVYPDKDCVSRHLVRVKAKLIFEEIPDED